MAPRPGSIQVLSLQAESGGEGAAGVEGRQCGGRNMNASLPVSAFPRSPVWQMRGRPQPLAGLHPAKTLSISSADVLRSTRLPQDVAPGLAPETVPVEEVV